MLATLFVASLVVLALVESVLMDYRQSRVVAQRQQGFWLAESGVQRSPARLAKSPRYEGETWTVPAQVLGAAHGGVVKIQVAKVT